MSDKLDFENKVQKFLISSKDAFGPRVEYEARPGYDLNLNTLGCPRKPGDISTLPQYIVSGRTGMRMPSFDAHAGAFANFDGVSSAYEAMDGAGIFGNIKLAAAEAQELLESEYAQESDSVSRDICYTVLSQWQAAMHRFDDTHPCMLLENFHMEIPESRLDLIRYVNAGADLYGACYSNRLSELCMTDPVPDEILAELSDNFAIAGKDLISKYADIREAALEDKTQYPDYVQSMIHALDSEVARSACGRVYDSKSFDRTGGFSDSRVRFSDFELPIVSKYASFNLDKAMDRPVSDLLDYGAQFRHDMHVSELCGAMARAYPSGEISPKSESMTGRYNDFVSLGQIAGAMKYVSTGSDEHGRYMRLQESTLNTWRKLTDYDSSDWTRHFLESEMLSNEATRLDFMQYIQDGSTAYACQIRGEEDAFAKAMRAYTSSTKQALHHVLGEFDKGYTSEALDNALYTAGSSVKDRGDGALRYRDFKLPMPAGSDIGESFLNAELDVSLPGVNKMRGFYCNLEPVLSTRPLSDSLRDYDAEKRDYVEANPFFSSSLASEPDNASYEAFNPAKTELVKSDSKYSDLRMDGIPMSDTQMRFVPDGPVFTPWKSESGAAYPGKRLDMPEPDNPALGHTREPISGRSNARDTGDLDAAASDIESRLEPGSDKDYGEFSV